MKKIVFVLFLTLNFVVSQEKSKIISGMVTDGRTVMENVKISVEGSNTQVFTDAQGRYRIRAEKGNIINYSYNGMESIDILIEDVTRILNVEMYPDIEELDEVVVTKSKRRSQQELELEYNSNPNLIKTAYGIIDPETAAYQIRLLSEEYISSVNLCIIDVLRNEFPGVVVNGDCINGGAITVRGASSLFNDQSAIYDIDGQILTDAPIWILPSNMKRVAVLSSFAATVKYGAIASGGVVIINTNVGSSYPKSKEIADKARLRNNKYMGDALSANERTSSNPVYLEELNGSTSLEEAKKVYYFYAPRYGASYGYYVDALTYFKENWSDEALEIEIVQDALLNFNENPVALKALAYVHQGNRDFEKANELYKEIFIQRPNYAQSYMDLANSYRELGDTKRAASLYARYDYLVTHDFLKKDTMAFGKIMDREFNNLIALHGRDIFSKNEVKKSVLEEDFNGTRLVFEWNDSEAEFELQFVNPENRYYTIKHALIADADRIRDEKLLGYSCEEFLIDESLPGTWQVNAKYLGNKKLTPTYLKATMYYDYGGASQRKETKIFKLGLRNVNQELFKIKNSTSVISN